MTDDTNEPHPISNFRTLREAARRPGAEAAIAASEAGTTEEHMRKAAQEVHVKSIALRTAARQDAVVVVARARERRGETGANWTPADADAMHLVTDLLLKLQGQSPSPLDPAFAKRDVELEKVARMTSTLDEAIRDDEPPKAS
jgi:hypothetical protein